MFDLRICRTGLARIQRGADAVLARIKQKSSADLTLQVEARGMPGCPQPRPRTSAAEKGEGCAMEILGRCPYMLQKKYQI